MGVNLARVQKSIAGSRRVNKRDVRFMIAEIKRLRKRCALLYSIAAKTLATSHEEENDNGNETRRTVRKDRTGRN